MQIGASRAPFAVPGHVCDGVLMGSYDSLVRFGTTVRLRHGICVFCAFSFLLWRYAARRMTDRLAASGVLVR